MEMIQFPIENPVVVLALFLLVMLVIPPVCKRIGMPAIFGLILSGILIGPKGFHLISEGSGLNLLSTAGLLYLMFLMTLEIDLFSFRKNKFKSVWFGFFTFVIPFILGFLLAHFVFRFNVTASLLLACMFSTHTLVSYPIVSRLNITKAEPVVISIGGTIITDMAVLLFLTIITTSYSGALNVVFWVKTILSLLAFIFMMFWGFPKVCRWYFRHFQSDDSAQYIFILCSLFLSGFMAELAGIEPIVGAFMCGLVLNRIIPHQSTLMSRTVFIGNTVFIPFFLIYIGTLVDLRVFIHEYETLLLALALIIVALASKYLAACATQLIYRYSNAERLLLFGLSSSHAAATIAVVIVGYRMEILDERVINGAVLIILFTCMVSSYITDHAGRIVALRQKEEQNILKHQSDRILVPVSNPETARPLFNFATLIHQNRQQNTSSISPLTIATSPAQLEHSILHDKTLSEAFISQAAVAKIRYRPALRIDSNISEGIIRAATEMQITHIVMGWSGQSGTARYFFGTIIENLLQHCPQTIMVMNLKNKMVKFGKIYVLVPRNADHEIGFQTWMNLLLLLRQNTSGELLLITDKNTRKGIHSMKETAILTEKDFRILSEFPDMKSMTGELRADDLLVVISARQNSVSYSRRVALAPRIVTRYFNHTSSMILYPEQPDAPIDNLGSTFGGI